MSKKDLIKAIDTIIDKQAHEEDSWFDIDTVGFELQEEYGIEDYDEYYELICERMDKYCEEHDLDFGD